MKRINKNITMITIVVAMAIARNVFTDSSSVGGL
uniref:Phr family secreted Rap phosphatase inhibitor n=1 Tax=Heterorhabditis bacteriophora TaxID=37862 RepID=A0A1I7XSP0_HETBA